MKDIDENAFSGGFNVARETMPSDEDLVEDDVPFNLAFVESYYGDQSKIKTSPGSSRSDHSIAEEHGDKLLAEGNYPRKVDLHQAMISVILQNLQNQLSPLKKGRLVNLRNKFVFSETLHPLPSETFPPQFVSSTNTSLLTPFSKKTPF